MKTMKKVAALLLALTMVLGLSLTAFAQDVQVNEGTNDGGSITVENATVGQTYAIYKIFDATYSGENVSYTYTKNGDNDELYTALTAEGSVFALTSVNGSNVYNVTKKSDNTSDADVITFVKSIASKLTALSSVAATETTLKFTNLDYGYYYITSTLGTLVTIDSAIPDETIKDKNTAPSNQKTVEEDSSSQYGNSNTADFHQVVNFKSTITAYPGALNYVLHDTMSSGLTFDSTSVKVTVGETTLTAGTDYTLVTTGLTDGCTFEVKFTDTYLNSISAQTTIVVSYSATVNENAVIGGTGNTNTTSLEYSNATETTKTPASTTTTYVYDVDILKYTGEDKTALPGAEFVLYKTVDGTNYYAKITDGKLTGWTKNSSSDCEEDSEDSTYATTLISGQDGTISVDGLDADTYYLEETKAPAGYNQLSAPVTFVIDTDGKVKVNNTEVTTVEIENKTGTELPETGGIGTTIFYVVGTILVLGAAVLLITKKRMTNVQ